MTNTDLPETLSKNLAAFGTVEKLSVTEAKDGTITIKLDKYLAQRLAHETRARTDDELRDQGRGAIERAYNDDVSSVAECLIEDIQSGNYTRDAFLDHVHECIDGHGRIMYTNQSMECLLVSRNADAYVEEFGETPIRDRSVNWEAMAFVAFQQDIMESISSSGYDVNDDEMFEKYEKRAALVGTSFKLAEGANAPLWYSGHFDVKSIKDDRVYFSSSVSILVEEFETAIEDGVIEED